MEPSEYDRLADPSPDAEVAFIAWLSKTALTNMRAAEFNQDQLKVALLRFFNAGLSANFALSELMGLMFLQPNAICFRVGYSSSQAKRIFEIGKRLTLAEIMSFDG